MDSSQALREARLLHEGREGTLNRVLSAEKKGHVGSLPYTNYLVRQGLADLVAQIKSDLDMTTKSRPSAYKKFCLYLGSIDPEIASLRAIQAILTTLFKTGGADELEPVWRKCATAAGKAIHHEYLMRWFSEINPAMFNSLTREYDRSMTRDEKHLIDAFKAKYNNEGYSAPFWDAEGIEGVGNYILVTLVASGFLFSATRTESRHGKATVVKYLSLAPELRGAADHILDVAAGLPKVAGPLIEKPLDWDASTNSGGGYHTPDMHRLLPYAVQGYGMRPMPAATIDSINELQSRAWQINAPVLKAVQAAALIRDFGDVVTANAGPKPEYPEDGADEDKAEWKVAARQWYTEKKVRAAKSRTYLKVVQEAVELMHYPAIWFAYFADFRNRKYARAFGVSPQGTDLAKGLLRMAEGKPVNTPQAEKWFRIHGANKFGLDKDDLPVRQAWSMDNHDLIMGIGAEPLDNLGWLDADSPVQFLAWCIEYYEWQTSGSSWRSHLAMSQDGTCNGLQNFSAVLCDPIGGEAVNLVPGEHQRDIYLDVSVAATSLLKDEPPSPLRDAWLAHGLNRKITKRTTMTLPYGCTRFACSEFIVTDYLQVVKPLEIQQADYGAAANYLSHIIWRALDRVVVKAREAMVWIQGWAKHTAKVGLPVQWATPNGLTVKSHYNKFKTKQIRSVAFKTANIRLYEPDDKVDLMRIANAAAPNFVHSLDSSHMDRVVLQAKAEGMSSVVIHDDFGVHAADTERFHQIIRECFVDMYKDSTLLQDMAAYSGYEVPPPDKGTLDLELIKQSTYFFA